MQLPDRRRKINIRILAIVFSLAAITGAHYAASVSHPIWHEAFQRAYYLPIIAAALWYGLKGGSQAATLAAFLYLPHIITAWHGFPTMQFDQYAEVGMFFTCGGLTGILSDRQRRQGERLQKTAQQLSEANTNLQRSFESLSRSERLSALGRLSAGLAHEIRNPLSVITGALNIIARPGLEPAQRDQFIADAKREIENLNVMLTHFLEFARPRPPQLQAVDLRMLIDEICRLMSEIATRRIAVRCVRPSFIRSLLMDPDQVRQIVLNLAINASDAMPEGGTIELSASEQADFVVLHVKDEGVGVPEQDLQRIFDPFYSTKPEGTGMGLSVAHQIMQLHGGRIEPARNPDRGMTFSLYFPRARQQTTPTESRDMP